MRILHFVNMVLWLALLLPANLLAQQDTVRYSFCPSAPVVKDHEGNAYRTVQIGSQCWMAENMRCTTSPTGKHWLREPHFTAAQPQYSPYYAIPLDTRYGVLYSWAAAIDRSDQVKSGKSFTNTVRGICPEGWHLPNNEEWGKLFTTLGGSNIAGELMKAPTRQWQPHLIIQRSMIGFDATPVGGYTENGWQYSGMQAFFWSADNFNRDQAWCCIIYDYKNEGCNYLEYKCYGHSVRCVKD